MYLKRAIVNYLPKILNKSANIFNLVDVLGSIYLSLKLSGIIYLISREE